MVMRLSCKKDYSTLTAQPAFKFIELTRVPGECLVENFRTLQCLILAAHRALARFKLMAVAVRL